MNSDTASDSEGRLMKCQMINGACCTWRTCRRRPFSLSLCGERLCLPPRFAILYKNRESSSRGEVLTIKIKMQGSCSSLYNKHRGGSENERVLTFPLRRSLKKHNFQAQNNSQHSVHRHVKVWIVLTRQRRTSNGS